MEQKLINSNEDLKQFAYAVSHDLQEPLRIVTNYTQLLERRYKERLDERAGKVIETAVNGALRMERLLRACGITFRSVMSRPLRFRQLT